MANEEGMPREAQIALSYLDDIKSDIDDIRRGEDNIYLRENAAQKVKNGDLALAYKELAKMDAQGIDTRRVRSLFYFHEGRLNFAVACASDYGAKLRPKWGNMAVECFEKSNALDQESATFYNLGLVFMMLERKTSAVQAFQRAEQLAIAEGNTQTSIDAAKEVRRLDPNGKIGASASAPSPAAGASGGYWGAPTAVAAAPSSKKKPSWIPIRNGAFAMVAGTLLLHFGIGIPIALIGFVMVIWGFTLGAKPD